MKTARFFLFSVLCFTGIAAAAEKSEADYYKQEHVYQLRPRPDREMHFGHVGVTGLVARVYMGVQVKIEKVVSDTPAEGKFHKGQIITGVNGISLAGKNPFVVLGNALDEAESTDGKLTFEIKDNPGSEAKKVKIEVPVLGKYGDRWPLDCSKSKKIIADAAEYYAKDPGFNKEHLQHRRIGGALACLFLLSTGEDRYIPVVKAYFERFPEKVEQIGDHTWYNGYNGIACAEYYLRTGDKSVLPIIQYYCDNARDRQYFECSWNHWGYGIGPGYVSGGLMNPAGCQVLTTLLLGLECGVKVDRPTLLNALRFWYRFAGHGTVPYGDHRPEGGLGSNGKDGMAAAMMNVAAGAEGDSRIYEMARDLFSMSTVTSYPVMVRGHGDKGRGDAMWRGIGSVHMIDKKPKEYREVMDRLKWWYTLSRRPSGGFGICALEGFDDPGSGDGVALSYTASLKNLRITGASRSKHAEKFTLPSNIWGRPADRVFLSIDHNPRYLEVGKPEPIHVPFFKFGNAYNRPEVDLKSVPREYMVRNACHKRYMIRCQACKALFQTGELKELEKLLEDPDPRVRRAALDGLIDYNYFFGMGRNVIKAEQFSPAIVKAVKKMLSNPDEALWVIDGALMALKQAPADVIADCLPLIKPWTKHEDWWLRDSSFVALSGSQKDNTLLEKVLPIMNQMMIDEYHTRPRQCMVSELRNIMRGRKDKPAGKSILAAFLRAVDESVIKPDVGKNRRSAEGAYNVVEAARVCLAESSQTALQVARKIQARFKHIGTREIVDLVAAPNSNPENPKHGLYTLLPKLPDDSREKLEDILFEVYLPELKRRMKEDGGDDSLLGTVIDLAKIRNPEVGWKPVGSPLPPERMWRFISFDPVREKDKKHPRKKRRFRDVKLPEGLEKWYMPEFDDSKWNKGHAPIGKGVHKYDKISFENRSEWGDGEFLLARTSFNLDAVDCDRYRVKILCKQGFHIYLNGKKIHTYVWWKDKPHYRLLKFDKSHLRKGKNVLAFYGNVEYLKGDANKPAGQVDLYIVGL